MKAFQKVCLLAVVCLFAGNLHAQTCTGPLATLTSPAPGSTLPAGAVTFAWCNAGADYFLTVESVFGAHDIFFAVVRVTSVTLGPACNIPTSISPQTGCIVPNGETIYVTLWTQVGTGKTSFQPGPTVTYTAAKSTAAPAATTTAVDNKTVGFSGAAQSVALTASVAGGIVNQGAVTFQVMDGAANVGTAVTSAALTSGSASVSYLLPGGTAARTYTIKATYSGGSSFQPSTGTGTLAVSASAPVAVPTTTAIDNKTVAFSSAARSVTLTAAVAGGIVNQGAVTFQVMDGATNVGAAVTSATLTSGSASVSYLLPGGTAAKSYTIHANYSGGSNFQPSTGHGVLTVSPTQAASFAGVVPIVLDVVGFAHYTSELQLTNLGAGPAAVRLSYTGSMGSGAGDVLEVVSPGQQVVFEDAIQHLRDGGLSIPASGNQGGTLIVTATTPGVHATIRTGADTVAPQPTGRSGLAYSDSDPAASAAAAQMYVYGLRTNDADRSNLAVYNMGQDPVSLKVTLVSGNDGSTFDVTAGGPLVLAAHGWSQYSGVLTAAGFSSGYAIVERVAGSGPFSAYAVVNDQVTNDGSFIAALPGTFAGSKLTVPVLVEAGQFESELILTNRGTATATFTLRYAESLSPAKGTGGTTTVDVPAGRQTIIPNVVDFLRSKPGVAIGARGASGYAGSLQIQVSGVGFESVFAGARTSAISPVGGEFGVFYPGISSSQEFSDLAFILGLKADANNRSNVAALHTGADGSGPITLEFQAMDGSNGGGAVGQPLTVILNPGQWAQPAGFFAGAGVPNGYVQIRRTAGTAPWYAYGVINDGGQPGQRTGDGSYVPGLQP